MASNVKIMNSKKIKDLLKRINNHWECSLDMDYVFLKNEKEEKIYIVSKEISKIDLSKLNTNSFGIYFAKENKGEISLSIEGAQIVGASAKKNIIDLNKKQVCEWLAGYDLQIESDLKGYVIVRYNKDFIGTGKIKEGKLLNRVPKIRRISQDTAAIV